MAALAHLTSQASDAIRRASRRQLSPQTREAIRRARRRFMPLETLSTAEWTEKYRVLAGGWLPGAFSFDNQPALRGIVEACDDPAVRELWGGKSAQFGWTQGVEINVIFRRVHIDPCPILVLFPKESAGKRFMREKLVPAIEATPVIAERIQTEKRGPDNAQDYKKFPGGFLQLIASNSPANVKSTDAPLVIVEEPDDTSSDVRGQGDSVVMARERLKSYGEAGKLIVGGTMTVHGLSKVEAGLQTSDKRRFYVACPHCQHEQTPRWAQVRWNDNATIAHPVYGTHRPETARYQCENDECATLWSDAEKNTAILRASQRADRGWRATAPFNGIAGFYISDLISINPGAKLELMVRLFLAAQHKLRNGDDSSMRSFINNQLGETWQLKSDAPEVEVLRDRAEDYASWTTPAGGLIATAGVDVQRGGEKIAGGLYYKVKTWGRGEESWRVAYGMVPGNVLEQATWDELEKILKRPIVNLGGGVLGISAISIDASDGLTNDAVFNFVRPRKYSGYMAIKGDGSPGKEIFSAPKLVDTTAMDKAAKYGLKLYPVGTEKAKDRIQFRLQLSGDGPGRMHWNNDPDVPADYYEQMTSQIKAPKGHGGRLIWVTKSGIRDEAPDCEMYALHAAYKLRINSWTEAQWAAVERQVRQRDLLSSTELQNAPTRIAADVPRGPSAGNAVPFTGFGTGPIR